MACEPDIKNGLITFANNKELITFRPKNAKHTTFWLTVLATISKPKNEFFEL